MNYPAAELGGNSYLPSIEGRELFGNPMPSLEEFCDQNLLSLEIIQSVLPH